MRLRLFGYPALDGDVATPTGAALQRQGLALLAVLARAPGRSLPRDKLLACLWPEADTAHARNRLNGVLHALRRTLGEEAVLSRGEEVILSPSRVTVDVEEFEAFLDGGHLEPAVSLYRAPFLDGFFLSGAPEFDDWAAREGARLAARYREALETLAAAAEGRGDFATAVHWWRAVVREDPASTRTVVGLMLALERSGQQAAALRAARDHEELLRRDFEAEPAAELSALVRRLREDPRPLDLVSPVPASITGTPSAARDPVLPTRRRRSLVLVGALAMGGLLSAAVVVANGRGAGLVRGRVVVSHFENRTGDPTLDPVGFLVADWITRGVIGLGLAEMVSSDEALRTTLMLRGEAASGPTVDLPRSLAREARARLAVGGSYYLHRDTLVFQARVIDAGTGRVLRALAEIRGSRDDLSGPATRLREQVAGTVATLLDERMSAWSDHAAQPPGIEAYHRYVAGMDAFLDGMSREGEERRSRLTEAADHFRATAALDSGFIAPVIWAIYSHWNGGRGPSPRDLLDRLGAGRDHMAPWDRAMADHVLAHASGDWARAYDAAAEAVRYAPDSEWVYKQAYAAAALNRPRTVIRLLGRLDPSRGWIAGWQGFWTLQATAWHGLGTYRKELATVQELERRFPDRDGHRFHRFRSRLVTGRVAEAAAIAEEARTSGAFTTNYLRELRVHGEGRTAEELANRVVEDSAATSVPYGTHAWRLQRLYFLWEAGRLDEVDSVASEVARSDSAAGLPPRALYHYTAFLARVAARRGDLRSAHALLDSMETMEPRVIVQTPNFVVLRAEVLGELGRCDEAVEVVRREVRRTGAYTYLQHAATDLDVLLRDCAAWRELVRPRD